MSRVRAVAERTVPAPPDRVFEVLADYATTRPHLLPGAYSDYRVESGGAGEGTVFTYRLSARGRERTYRMRVTETEAGRRIVEADQNSSLVTTWTLVPENGETQVAVETTWQGAGGIGGFFEGLFAPGGVRRLHEQVLDNLAARVGGAGSPAQ